MSQHSQKVIARCHVNAADRLLLIMEHEAGCNCCRFAREQMERMESRAADAVEVWMGRATKWEEQTEKWRAQSRRWMVVACWPLPAVIYLAVRAWG